MATFRFKNYSRSKLSNLVASNGDTFEDCNFHQSVPNTAILSGLAGLTFRRCNLMNCTTPTGAVIEDCMAIQKSFCAHLHPNRVDAGEISAEIDNCSHVVDTDEIWIDGVKIDTIYHYKDTVL